jgi:hypothetical protein
MNGNTVWVGPNGWPIIWMTLFVGIIAWWFYRSSNNLPVLPTRLTALAMNFRDYFFPYARATLMSSVVSEEERLEAVQNEDEPAVQVGSCEQRTQGSGAFIRQTEVGTQGSVFSLTNDELGGVRRMITYHKETLALGEQPTKSGAILAGFNRKRGGSSEYIRASDIYDALFGAPEPAVKFRPLTEDSKPVFQELN